MANDITSSGSFTITNMKPESGEQVDSLWGQNIADNTGYLYFKPEVLQGHSVQLYGGVAGLQGANNAGTQYFIKRKGHNTLIGSYNCYADTDAAFGGTTWMYVNGTLLKQIGFTPNTSGTQTSGSISFDISGFTDGVAYKTSYRIQTFAGNMQQGLDWSLWSVP